MAGPFSSNSRLKNIRYLELRYLELSLSRTNYLVPYTVITFRLLSRTFVRIFKLECSNNFCIFFTAFFRCFNIAVKRKLAVKTLAEKCHALRDLENGISNKNVAEKYGVPKNTVSTWLKNKEKRFTALEKSSNKRKKVRESNYPDKDNVVFKWFLSQRGKSIPIDRTFIKEKAMKYAKELGAIDFKASDGWLGRWKKGETFCI